MSYRLKPTEPLRNAGLRANRPGLADAPAWTYSVYQRTSAVPQVSPAPKPLKSSVSPR